MKQAGFEELHAAFLNESRTSGTLWDRVQEIRVSARFWQMWDHDCLPVTLHWRQVLMSTVIYTLYTQGAEVCGIPHLPKPGRYGVPVICYGPGREKLRLVPQSLP